VVVYGFAYCLHLVGGTVTAVYAYVRGWFAPMVEEDGIAWIDAQDTGSEDMVASRLYVPCLSCNRRALIVVGTCYNCSAMDSDVRYAC
jgi:hypothetical protein